jgi:hypothetical protein
MGLLSRHRRPQRRLARRRPSRLPHRGRRRPRNPLRRHDLARTLVRARRPRGPLDLAFLPINGVLVRLDGYTPTDVPATLTPEQAVEAAVVLQARTACAIHHGLFDNPPATASNPLPSLASSTPASAEASQQPRRTTATLSSAEVGQSGLRPARATVQDHHYAPTTQPIALRLPRLRRHEPARVGRRTSTKKNGSSAVALTYPGPGDG